jgi:hypothetical protein
MPGLCSCVPDAPLGRLQTTTSVPTTSVSVLWVRRHACTRPRRLVNAHAHSMPQGDAALMILLHQLKLFPSMHSPDALRCVVLQRAHAKASTSG